MRTRIALATAVAVIIAIPTILFTFVSNTAGAAIPVVRHEAVRLHHSATAHHVNRANSKIKVMSYADARKLSKLITYANAVEAQQRAAFFEAVTAHSRAVFFQAVAAQQVAANSFAAIPAAWKATAICEEGGRNDPYAGFFGILAWNGFDGYPTAGSAPLSVQLAWEAHYIGAPPDAPGQCHAY